MRNRLSCSIALTRGSGQARRTPPRPRRTIFETIISVPESLQPLRRRPRAATRGIGGLAQRPAFLEHAPADQHTTARAGPMITVELHPGPPSELGAYDTPSLQGGPD